MTKNKIILWISSVILIITAGLIFYFQGSNQDRKIQYLERPKTGEGDRNYSLWVIHNGQKQEIAVSLSERAVSEEELDGIFSEAYERLITEFLGENESLNEITDSVILMNELSQYSMKVEWFIDDTEIINYWGDILAKKECENHLTATLTYKGQTVVDDEKRKREYEVVVYIKPPLDNISSIERIQSLIKGADESAREQETVPLPDRVDGEEVSFYEKNESVYLQFLMLIMLLPVVVVIKHRVGKDNAKKSREEELICEYPELITKLSLLIGAGMTPYNALCRIAEDGAGEAYVEIRAMIKLIQSGISEKTVYRQFGERFGLHCYCKLGTLLEQNIVRGNEHLRQTLKEEVREALEDRRARARKAGEQAGTKLLLPMILMLMVVMIIIMVPAFLSF